MGLWTVVCFQMRSGAPRTTPGGDQYSGVLRPPRAPVPIERVFATTDRKDHNLHEILGREGNLNPYH